MTFKEYKEHFKDKKRLVKTIIFTSVALGLSIFTLVNAGIDGSHSVSFSDFISTIFSNIINAGQDKEVPVVKVEDISLSLPSNSLNNRAGYEANEVPFGGTKMLQATISPANATNKGIIFSSNSDHVKLSQSGTSVYVEIDELGDDYEIVATSQFDNEIKASYKFSCVELAAPVDFEISNESVTIQEGLTTTLDIENTTEGVTYAILGNRYYDENKLVYTSLNESVVKVENNGVLRGLSSGTATVNVSNGTITKSIEVTVQDDGNPIVGVSSMNITSSSLVAYLGDVDYDGPSYGEEGLHNTPLSIDWGSDVPSDQGVTYTSSNPLVALVNEDGLVRGYRNKGTTTIRATSNYDPSIYSEVEIEVKEVIAESLTLNTTIMELEHGSYSNIPVAISPINTTNKAITVTSSNSEILTVNNFGSSIRIYGATSGTASFTVSSKSNPELSVTKEIKITPKGIINEDNQEDVFAFLRKSIGHFSVFLVTGIFGTLSLYYLLLVDINKKKWFKTIAFVSSLIYGFAIAGFSELIQYFTPMRDGNWKDVGIDTLGYAIGLSFVLLFFVIYKAIKNRKEQKKKEN